MNIADKNGEVTFLVREQPRASRNEVVGEHQRVLKIRLTAQPINGRGHDALCRFLSSRLNVPTAAVKIASGERSRTKRVEIKSVMPPGLKRSSEEPARSSDASTATQF